MRLARARVQNYRCILDSGWFQVEYGKTILVGQNEAGKTALLKALQHTHPSSVVKGFDPLRDYPRSEYHRIQSGAVRPENVVVVEAEFDLDDNDRTAIAAISPDFGQCRYGRSTFLDNSTEHELIDAPPQPILGTQKDTLRRLAAHADGRLPAAPEGVAQGPTPSEQLNALLEQWTDDHLIGEAESVALTTWLDTVAAPYVDEGNHVEMQRFAGIRAAIAMGAAHNAVLELLDARVPVVVYFSTYTRVRPMLHLRHLADAIDAGAIDQSDDYYFGNACLLKLLGFSARQLSDLGSSQEPAPGDMAGFEAYRAGLDERAASLNAASLSLTEQIKAGWQPPRPSGATASSDADYNIAVQADQQYLRVVVKDARGVETDLDQRSEGFQWLVSFFIVFFAEAQGQYRDAILLLDEPGLSLHGLKQREFRETLTKLAESNQLIFTTHSPFLVGSDELDLVRVVEVASPQVGTKVHTEITAEDPASLLPLQEALGYDLAQSLFVHTRNLVLEGLIDYWYVEATAQLLRDGGGATLNDQISLIPAGSAGKVVYFATILHANKLKVAALLDSDAAGDQAANQETLVHTLDNKRIIRTKDSYSGPVAKVEVEDLLRDTLVEVAKQLRNWDVKAQAVAQATRPIADVFADVIGSNFSKYHLAKSYLKWTRDHTAEDLTEAERAAWKDLIERVNRALR